MSELSVTGGGDESKPTLSIPKENLVDIMQFDSKMRQQAGISILTPDARVLFWIALKGSTSVSDAMGVAKTSYASFFSVLKRLKQSKLIDSAKDETDSRVRRLYLNHID